MNAPIFPRLDIPNTIAAGPGPGNTADRVLAAYTSPGVADHMQPDVLRGMIECKQMLREIFGTQNVHTFGIAGTGWSGLDAMFSVVHPGDKIVMFVNGTFSDIDALSVRMKAATEEELNANPLDPQAASVITIRVPHGQSVTGEIVEAALAEHKPKWAAMAHWETGSGRVNDVKGFSEACERHGVLGLIDAVSSLGIAELKIDDHPGIVGWASCPQKGMMALPLTYAPVSFSDRYIAELRKIGARSFVHHPLMEARHWGIIDGQDVEKGTYHRTHSPYAVASFHEALRMVLEQGLLQRSERYRTAERALRAALQAMGCTITSNMTSLIVLDLPGDLKGREKEFVTACRSEGFGIWPTLSEPTQVRVGILNLLSEEELTTIVRRFGEMLNRFDVLTDIDAAVKALKQGIH
ncbi:aminotransferase class V-fold PLP-dependent enzyme [Jiella sp. MQZ9-1]|uniref:Alanine--glyoxylate aminotransferase family protein n=1 Tax=Jiella flava TaxID=2816857 RepID=A0A939FXH6_9HYPH|nr:aminotransferase class V-fold PLP-dependent enzyme [Jiella flava]MBO0663803.1 alanine--glyoxylate aminotransferase family protein [Jiella flava]MCD2472376.1 aminotransferase class V-fold PLP-dependent enzyme [Jiella flava]